MAFRTGVYIVPTHRWYIERTVWLIAGTVLLIVTPMAAFLHPLWSIGIVALAMFSITVSLTGFCFVGNALYRLGFTPMLGQVRPDGSKLYLMQTDRWYLERRIYMAVGINLTVATVLSLVHSLWWLVFPAFVGAAMLVFAGTGFCIMANSLYWLGAEPRLAPERDASCAATSRAPLEPLSVEPL
jgi:hypothetical protein